MPGKPRLPFVQERGGVRVDEEKVAERGGGRRRSLPVGLPVEVGGGDGGRDAPAHPLAVPEGLPGAEYLFGVPLRVARERRPEVRLVGTVEILPIALRFAPALLRRGDLRPSVPGELPAVLGSTVMKYSFVNLLKLLYIFLFWGISGFLNIFFPPKDVQGLIDR